jgi:ribosome-associated heat shock protein Hsp15
MELKNKDINRSIRIDKWLWAVRLFKTRSQATQACKKGIVIVNGDPVKPSYTVKTGITVELKSAFITRTFLVKGLLEKRVSAKVAVIFVEETTAPELFEKLAALRNSRVAVRDRGAGRPTKKERRNIDRLMEFYD